MVIRPPLRRDGHQSDFLFPGASRLVPESGSRRSRNQSGSLPTRSRLWPGWFPVASAISLIGALPHGEAAQEED